MSDRDRRVFSPDPIAFCTVPGCALTAPPGQPCWVHREDPTAPPVIAGRAT